MIQQYSEAKIESCGRGAIPMRLDSDKSYRYAISVCADELRTTSSARREKI